MTTYSLDAEVDMTNKKARSKQKQPVSVLTDPVDNAKVIWVFKKGLTEDQTPGLDIPSAVLASSPRVTRVDKLLGAFDHWEIEAEIKFPFSERPAREYKAEYKFYVTEGLTKHLLSFEAAFSDPDPYLVIDRNGDPPDRSCPHRRHRRHRLNASYPAGGSGTPAHP